MVGSVADRRLVQRLQSPLPDLQCPRLPKPKEPTSYFLASDIGSMVTQLGGSAPGTLLSVALVQARRGGDPNLQLFGDWVFRGRETRTLKWCVLVRLSVVSQFSRKFIYLLEIGSLCAF